MYIEYRTRKLYQECNEYGLAVRHFGQPIARKLNQRLVELKAAECIADLNYQPPTRCHPLDGRRKGQFAIDLVHPYRLIFEPLEKQEGNVDLTLIKSIKIMEVVDYHD